MANLKPQKVKQVESPNNLTETKDKFIRHIIHENAIATNDIRSEKFDMDKAKQKSSDAMIALCVNGGYNQCLLHKCIPFMSYNKKQ